MKQLICWTLQRGIIDPPEALDDAEEAARARYIYALIDERDPKLTQEQYWMVEGRRYGYVRRRGIV